MQNHVQRLFRRIQGLFQLGSVTVAGDDSGDAQKAQVTVSGQAVRGGLPVVQDYGFSAVLPAGVDALIFSLSGDATSGVIVGTLDKKNRPKNLKPGQVCLFTQAGDQILLDNGDDGITITPKGGTVLINGNCHITGKLTVDGDVVAAGISLDDHTHSGVEAGSDDTGKPVS
ncbi:phage baseplate assembly protein [Acetobacter oeni]|uniref:Baseplate assembly protein n=1 Tax=Acetobacter oeni TaxID=304077 RepID=A0A511XP05_9PROT|nr:phage baseplate assembly protein [Acetobacter oeni]MBB3884496.1 phage gp45-like [Acetobacter oeni]NHO20428.1 hypothetical protein [Acetobacter oeni]GBR00554.1 Mu-like prophage protein gp45 [Acetobacter oeni LMG 21952]GEN64693.1 baseplate assembly protein [Acetobacter oeni]